MSGPDSDFEDEDEEPPGGHFTAIVLVVLGLVTVLVLIALEAL